jgi:methylmalonyl-CoA epimerase
MANIELQRISEGIEMKVDHIGIAVKDLQDTLNLYKKILDNSEVQIEEVPTEKVRVAMIPLGDTRIELLEPMSDESAIAKFIKEKGEGVHHIAVAVEDIKASIGKLSAEGLRVLYPEPRPGSHGKMITFVHPKSTRGVLLELCQLPK